MISHLNKNNKPQIVDISNKKITDRIAIAEGYIKFSKSSFKRIESYKTKKGEIKSIAIVAGIMGAKKTNELIPLCHNVEIENINIDIITKKKINSLKVTANIKSRGKTGVEMEALTAVTTALLTLYDMCKSIDKSMLIKDIKLVKKSGGKTDFQI